MVYCYKFNYPAECKAVKMTSILTSFNIKRLLLYFKYTDMRILVMSTKHFKYFVFKVFQLQKTSEIE